MSTAVEDVSVAIVRLEVPPDSNGNGAVSVTRMDRFTGDVPAMLDTDTCTVYVEFLKAPCSESIEESILALFSGFATRL